jgi:CRP-like cAMP-binding protein
MPNPLHATLAHVWGLSSAQAAQLGREAQTLDAARGESVARRGRLLPGVLFVQTGMVKLSLRSADGEERILRIVGANQAFGEPTAMLGRPCLYDAVALTDTRVVTVAPHALFALLARDARFARRLVLALAERSFTVLAELQAATTQRGAQRLAGYLGSLPPRAGATGCPAVDLPVSKTVVAARLGMKKETLSRLLHQFVRDGIIEVRRREIAILDRARLDAAASG